MKKSVLPAFLVLLAALTAVAPGPASAQTRRARTGNTLPLDRLLPEIRRTHPGQIYDAEGPMPGPDGEPQYRLKWMTPDGRIVWLDADARTGRVLGYPAPPPPSYSPPRERFGVAPSFGHDAPPFGHDQGGRYGSPYFGRERSGGRHGGDGRGRDRRWR